MTSARYTKFRDIDSHVLKIIQSTHRGADLSELVKWGQETGSLYQEARKYQTRTVLRLICDNCGKNVDKLLYEQRKALTQGSRDAYCSRKCCMAHHSFKNSKPCIVCGKTKTLRQSKYCSEDCKVSERERKISARRRARPVKKCAHCGNDYQGSAQAYCSVTCANEAHSLRMAGAGNSKFRGNTRYSNQFRDMRFVILERDGYCCGACGRREMLSNHRRKRSNLETHHIDENPSNNVPENLIMLCIQCHRHHHFGLLEKSPLLPIIAANRSRSMTSKLKDRTTFLRNLYLPTTAS